MMKRAHQFAAAAASAAAVLCATPAFAAFPGSVVGVWTVVANNTPITMTITSMSTTGRCRLIAGTMSNANTRIEGYYCPASGEIAFVRKNLTTNDTFQSYHGAAHSTGTVNRMSGAFDHSASPTQGQYGWTAQK